MGRPKLYATASERKRAQRRRQRDQAVGYAQLVLLQENAAQEHVGAYGRLAVLQRHATAEQRRLQEERQERDMLDALWLLQTLVADFGYGEVERCVLQHVRPLPS